MSQLDLGIAIVSYNTRQLTENCLCTVYDEIALMQALPHSLSAQVWLVDNASGDGSPDMVREQFPQVHLTASADNLGFAGGTNLAIEQMRQGDLLPRFVLLLNPDTLVQPHALWRMLNHLADHPRVGVVGAQLEYGDGSFQHGAFHFPTLLMTLFDFWTPHHRIADSRFNGRYPRTWYERGEPFAIDHPLGAALMIRGETLAQVGLLDTEYFMYCEEIDWCMRISQAGWEIRCVPQAKITHLAGQSTGQFRDRMFIALWQSRYRLFQKHYGRLYNRCVRAIVRFSLSRRIKALQGDVEAGRIKHHEASSRIAAYQCVMEID